MKKGKFSLLLARVQCATHTPGCSLRSKLAYEFSNLYWKREMLVVTFIKQILKARNKKQFCLVTILKFILPMRPTESLFIIYHLRFFIRPNFYNYIKGLRDFVLWSASFSGLFEKNSGSGMAALLFGTVPNFFGKGRKLTIGTTWRKKQDHKTGNNLRQTSGHPPKPDKQQEWFSHVGFLLSMSLYLTSSGVLLFSESFPSFKTTPAALRHRLLSHRSSPSTRGLKSRGRLREKKEVDPGQRLFCFSATKWWSHWRWGAN